MARGGRKTGATGSHSIQSYLQARDGEECRTNNELATENGTSEKKADENDGLVPFPKKRKKRNDTSVSPSKRALQSTAVRTSKRVQERRRKQAEEAAELADDDDSTDSLQCSPSDLRKEAKVVDEEYAKLTAGRPVHPFFLMHKLSEQSNTQCKARADPESLQNPSSPFHVTQTEERKNIELNWNYSFVKTTPLSIQDTDQNCDNFTLTCQGAASKLAVSVQGCLFPSASSHDGFSEILNYVKSGALLCDYPSIEDLKDKYQIYKAMNIRESTSELSNETSNPLWTDIYRPRNAEQICGNRVPVNQLNNWLRSWKLKVQSEKSELSPSDTGAETDSESWFQDDDSDTENEKENCRLQNIALLIGPVGCGKSAAVYACANEQGFEVIEINSSDIRTGAVIKHKIGEALESQSLDWFSTVEQAGQSASQNRKMAMILFEEVDTLFDEDKGFMSALVELDKTAKRPIVLTSNKPKPVLPHLKKVEIKFTKPTTEEMVLHASMVCLSRGICGSPWTMLRIVQSSAQDLRKMMMLLQLYGQGGGDLQANQDGRGCLLKDSLQLFSATTRTDSSTDERNDPQAVWWFNSDAQFSMLPRLFSMSYPCSLAETVAAKVSSAVQEAERTVMLAQVKAAVEASLKRQSPRKKGARKRSERPSPMKSRQIDGLQGETGSPSKSKARRALKRLRRLNDIPKVEVSSGLSSVGSTGTEVICQSSEQDATLGASRTSCTIPRHEAHSSTAEVCSQEVQLDTDRVKNHWLELQRGKQSLECDCKPMHQTALSVCRALAETAERLSSCDVISSGSLENFDLAAHLAQASLHHVSDELVSATSSCEEALSQTPSWHEQDLQKLHRQKLLREELFYANPKFARESMTRAGFTDYTSFMARIKKLDERTRSECLRPKNRRSRGYQDDYLTQLLVPEKAIQALGELFNFSS